MGNLNLPSPFFAQLLSHTHTKKSFIEVERYFLIPLDFFFTSLFLTFISSPLLHTFLSPSADLFFFFLSPSPSFLAHRLTSFSFILCRSLCIRRRRKKKGGGQRPSRRVLSLVFYFFFSWTGVFWNKPVHLSIFLGRSPLCCWRQLGGWWAHTTYVERH